jgi:hypothetical protein
LPFLFQLAAPSTKLRNKTEKHDSCINRSQLETEGRRIIQLYEDWQKPNKAAEWRKKLVVTK